MEVPDQRRRGNSMFSGVPCSEFPHLQAIEAEIDLKIFLKGRRTTMGQEEFSSLSLRTMRYSLRRALSSSSVDGGTHNPTITHR
jgi:hypothetical protein